MSCIHFWEIETATGPTSRAVCRKCGKRDELHNRLAFKRIRGMVKPVAPEPIYKGKGKRIMAHSTAEKWANPLKAVQVG